MGTGSSKNPRRDDGGQLHVSLKMENSKINGDLTPHVYGSLPIAGSWDSSKALSMQRESASMWQLSFVIPPNHETLDFKFLLKPNYGSGPCVVEEGPDRLLTGGTLEGDASAAVFRLPGEEEALEFRVLVKADILSPFDLAASWRAYQENLQPSRVRRIPDVSINAKYDGVLEKAMPAAAGAVAAAAVADRMYGPKEDQKLAIVLVGLPARGKTFTAAKLTRYLRWLGHETKHFNVGKYRRLKHGANQSADFFRGDNPEGMEARNEVAALAMDDMLSWMQEGGQVGIFDATNSTRERRNMLMKMAEGKCKIWTSTLQRTVLTASPIAGFPKIQWRALDEINVGVCDGMTYEEIKRTMPEEFESRKKDKLIYRYPRGESYLDVIQRLEPVIIELERQRAPVIIISHQAVLRALYAYFADRPLTEIPHVEVPLHTIIEIQMGVAGVEEKRYKLMD